MSWHVKNVQDLQTYLLNYIQLQSSSAVAAQLPVTGKEVFTHVPLLVGELVGLLLGLHKNYQMDFHKAWLEGGSQLQNRPHQLFVGTGRMHHGFFFSLSQGVFSSTGYH